MNEKEFEFKRSLESIVLRFFSTPRWEEIINENPDKYLDLMEEAISASVNANSPKDIPKWLKTELDKLGAFVSEEEQVKKSLEDWNPNE